MTKKGFTLIELLVVIAIIGTRAALAIPNLLMSIDKSKKAKALQDIEALNNALRLYEAIGARLPEGSDEISTLLSGLTPEYIGGLPRNTYNLPYYYQGADGDYSILSYMPGSSHRYTLLYSPLDLRYTEF